MFLLDLQSKVPINLQIRQQIIRFIAAGVLKPNDRLPSVRQLAAENGINPNTVAKAYAELEKDGFVYNMPKKGVYVAERSVKSPRDPITETLRQWKAQGATEEELVRRITELYREDDHVED